MSSELLDDTVPTPVVPLARRAIRSLFVPRITGQLLVKPSFTPERVEVRDIARGGVGLIVPRPLEVDTVVALQLLPRPWADLGSLMARVIYVLPEHDDAWRVGCAFARHFKRNELATLLSQCTSVLRYE